MIMNCLSSKVFLILTLVCFTLATPTQLFAQSVSDSSAQEDSSDEKMAEYVKLGTEAFQNEEFEKAATFFEKAFDQKQVDVLLKNSMVAWYKAGRCSEALRVAARLVSFVGNDDLSHRVDSEVTTVVDCALNDVESDLEEGKYSRAKGLLTIAGTTQPTQEQKERIDQYWRQIPVDIDSDKEATNEPTPVTFHSVAPWLGGGLAGLGLAFVIGGTVALSGDKPSPKTGITLVTLGALSLMGGAGLLIYWAATKENASQPGVSIYKNDNYAHLGEGIHTIYVTPTLSFDRVGAGVGVVF